MNQVSRNIALWLVVVLMFLLLFNFFSRTQRQAPEERFSEFLNQVDSGDVKEVTIQGNVITGIRKNTETFRTYAPQDPDLVKTLRTKGVDIAAKPADGDPWWMVLLVQWFPMLLLVGVWIFFMRQMQIGGGKAMSFGKSRAKLLTENTHKVTFADVAGIDEAKDELEEIIQFLKDPKRFTRLGGRIPKGVLLVGAPGTGKTLLARAIAGEAGVPFFSISGSDFVEMFVGVGASRVRDLFVQGKKHAPCIIFIDEIDAVGRHRGAGLGGGHDEREQTLNQLLVEMDGFEANEGVILVAATNRPDVLDPALLRPGRFDRRVVVPLPDVRGREEILRVHTRKIPLADDVDLAILARGTPGFTGADLENLVNEAALLAARRNKDKVEMADFELAKDKVTMGAERRSMVMSAPERKIIAYHEGGHALVAMLQPGADPVHKVTIIPRGMALGLTQMLPKEDRLNWNRQAVLDHIAMAMGGRIAEELQFNEITSGAKSDIDHATQFARSMVCEWGMSEKLGPLALGEDQQEVFLGREFGHRARNFSENTAIDIDEEVRQLVTTHYQRAKNLLVENKSALDRIADALLEWETLDGADVEALLAGQPLKPRPATPAKMPEAKRPEVKEKSKILDALGGLAAPVPKVETGKA